MEQNGMDLERKPRRFKKPKLHWVTATIAANLGREELLAATFREIIFHLTSLILLTIYIFSQSNNSEYFLTESLKKSLDVTGQLNDVINVDFFWAYIENKLIKEIYEYDFKLSSADREAALAISDENYILGVPRIRQVKVNDNSCEIHGYFRRLFIHCYSMFSSEVEDRGTFGLRTPTAWIYSDASETKSITLWGTLTTYSGGGFYMDFTRNENETTKLFHDLHNNIWITRGTRAIFVDFSVYNLNTNLFCICKLIFEFLPPGGVTPSYKFTPATLTPFPGTWNWTLRIFLYLFCIYIVNCLFEEIREMIYFRGAYIKQFWNYVDISVIFLTFCLLVGTEYVRIVVAPYVNKIMDNPTRYGNLERISVIYETVKIIGATLLFTVYLRTFKYLSFNRRMAQLNNTIRNCAKDILGFSVMFFVAYIAYAELGFLVFGSQIEDFSNFGRSMFTLLRTILGDFDYDEIHAANWLVAPVYFLTYIILVFFILLNMFLAIINDTYADVKIDIAIAPNEMEMTEFVKLKLFKLFGKLGCKIKKRAKKNVLVNANLNLIRETLTKCKFNDREIEMYFTRYDINPLKDLQKEDIERFFEKFAQEDLAKEMGEEHVVSWKDFQRQDDKLVELENALVMLGQKVQELLLSVETPDNRNQRLQM